MKKVLLILSIIGLFTLSSCSNPDIYLSTDPNEITKTDNEPNQDEKPESKTEESNTTTNKIENGGGYTGDPDETWEYLG